MAIYRFRVSFEDYEDVSREIEIRSDQTFGDLHVCIQSAISFDGTRHSSFFMSNDNWLKGKEITSHEKTDKTGKKMILMRDAKLSSFIIDPHQKIYYIVDGDMPWSFHIELVKILPSPDLKNVYPRISKTVGEAPRQYVVTVPPPGSGEEDFIDLMEDGPEQEDDNMVEAVDADDLGEGMSEEGETSEGEEENEPDADFDDVQMSGGDEDDR